MVLDEQIARNVHFCAAYFEFDFSCRHYKHGRFRLNSHESDMGSEMPPMSVDAEHDFEMSSMGNMKSKQAGRHTPRSGLGGVTPRTARKIVGAESPPRQTQNGGRKSIISVESPDNGDVALEDVAVDADDTSSTRASDAKGL